VELVDGKPLLVLKDVIKSLLFYFKNVSVQEVAAPVVSTFGSTLKSIIGFSDNEFPKFNNTLVAYSILPLLF